MKFVLFTLSLLTLSLSAAEVTSQLPKTTAGKLHGIADFRPSYMGVTGEMHTENALELGYDFNPKSALFYRQEFNTNLYNPGKTTGVNSTAGDGYIKGMNYELVPFEGTAFTLGYEGRAYLPTMERKRNAGMLTAIRNYVWLAYKATNNLNVYLAEVPVVHIYNRVGDSGAANPFFENKVELVAEYIFSPSLKLVAPLKLSTTKYSSYAEGAFRNNAWVNNLYFYPELHYRIAPNWKVGAAFYTGALTDDNFSRFTISDGLKNTTFQTFVIANL